MPVSAVLVLNMAPSTAAGPTSEEGLSKLESQLHAPSAWITTMIPEHYHACIATVKTALVSFLWIWIEGDTW